MSRAQPNRFLATNHSCSATQTGAIEQCFALLVSYRPLARFLKLLLFAGFERFASDLKSIVCATPRQQGDLNQSHSFDARIRSSSQIVTALTEQRLAPRENHGSDTSKFPSSWAAYDACAGTTARAMEPRPDAPGGRHAPKSTACSAPPATNGYWVAVLHRPTAQKARRVATPCSW